MKKEKPKHKYKADDMNHHAYALWEVSRVMNQQNQPVNLIEGDKNKFVIQLRINLNKVQAERLIVKKLQEDVADYKVIADFGQKTLTLVKVKANANRQSRKNVTSGHAGETADRGVPGS